MFQDGRVVFVRNGAVFVRVSPNRLIKAGSEFHSADDIEHSCATRGVEFEKPVIVEPVVNCTEMQRVSVRTVFGWYRASV